MDLNKAMVGLYQKRTAEENRKRLKVELTELDLGYKPKATFDEIYGCDSPKNEIRRFVDDFKNYTDEEVSDWPIMICGSQGLGKTSLVEAGASYGGYTMVKVPVKSLARQTRIEFFKENLEQMIRYCISIQPAIVLVDDLDRLGEKEDFRLLMEDAIERLVESHNKLLVFCTTSSTIEEAPRVSFSSVIYLKRPDGDARFKILQSLRSKYQRLSSLDDSILETLARNTPSFTAPDLQKMLMLVKTKSPTPRLGECNEAIEEIKQSFNRGTHLIGQKPSVTWDDVGGMSTVRQTFSKILRQTKRGVVDCKFAGVALYGPPGCGKTMVAQAMANEGGFNFISIKPAELINKYLGETEKNIRRVFQDAREHEPCMIYFDEFDGLCGSRQDKNNITSAIQTLLAEMDGFVNRGQSMILASTNRLEDIDDAMKRPGRLTKHIYIGPPSESARKDILSVITSSPSISLEVDIDLDAWAKKTDTFTGADLAFLVAEAEAKAIEEADTKQGDSRPITLRQEHFEFAMNEIKSRNRGLNKRTNTKRGGRRARSRIKVNK